MTPGTCCSWLGKLETAKHVLVDAPKGLASQEALANAFIYLQVCRPGSGFRAQSGIQLQAYISLPTAPVCDLADWAHPNTTVLCCRRQH